MAGIRSDLLVVYGATGNLARRKLLPALYELTRRGRLDLPVVGVACSDHDDAAFRRFVRQAVEQTVRPGGSIDEAAFTRLVRRLTFVRGDSSDPRTHERLAEWTGAARRVTHFLATPPDLFHPTVTAIAATGAHRDARIVVEKPFGADLDSARRLNALLREAFDERAILRLDHYLGREAVENLLVFRFANALLAPLWDRSHIASVQFTQCETDGIDGRGALYESVGALRDVVQNHLLVVVGLLAMEPPVDDSTAALHDAHAAALRAVRPVDPGRLVRGQYAGYLAEPGVAPASTVETYVACRLDIDTPRWRGVPFHLRAGKGLAATAQEVVIRFREPPATPVFGASNQGAPNLLRFRIGPNPGVTLTLHGRAPGRGLVVQPVDLRLNLADLGEQREAYQRLIDDALDGRDRRFVGKDSVEESWRVVGPALATDLPVIRYPRGTWGPEDANHLLDGECWIPPLATR